MGIHVRIQKPYDRRFHNCYYHPKHSKSSVVFYVGWTVDFLILLLSYSYMFQMVCYHVIIQKSYDRRYHNCYYHPNHSKPSVVFYVGWTVDFLTLLLSYSYSFKWLVIMLEYKNHMTEGIIIAITIQNILNQRYHNCYYHPKHSKPSVVFYVGWTVDFLTHLLSYSYMFQMACYDHPMNFFHWS
jgi:hypothetical protein